MIRNAFMLILVFTFSLSLINCSEDNDRRSQRRSPEENAKLLREKLNLTDEQTKQVEKIYINLKEERTKARENFDGDRRQLREIMMKYREKTNQQIEEILNENQIKIFQEYLGEQQERMRERMRSREN